MTNRQQIAAIVTEMLKTGRPERCAIRFNKLSLTPGFAIENEIGIAIGDTFDTLEEAHKTHSKAWLMAWDQVPA